MSTMPMSRFALWILLVIFSCSSAAEDAGFVLTVEARHIRQDRTQTVYEVSDGAVLRSGDGLRIKLEILMTSPVYLLLVGSSGNPSMVLPPAADDIGKPVPAGAVIEIPSGRSFFPLDDNPGEEAVFAFTGDASRDDIVRLLTDIRSANGDLGRVTRLLIERFEQVERVAFQHISADPLMGIDTAAPELRKTDDNQEGAGPGVAPGTTAERYGDGKNRKPQFKIPEDVGDEMSEVLSEEGSLIPPDIGGGQQQAGEKTGPGQ